MVRILGEEEKAEEEVIVIMSWKKVTDNYCRCGCGTPLKRRKYRYAQGHWFKTEEGKKHSRINGVCRKKRK